MRRLALAALPFLVLLAAGCDGLDEGCNRLTDEEQRCALLSTPDPALALDAALPSDAATAPLVAASQEVTLPPGGEGWVRVEAIDGEWAVLTRPDVDVSVHPGAPDAEALEGTELSLGCAGKGHRFADTPAAWIRLGPTLEETTVLGIWEPGVLACE